MNCIQGGDTSYTQMTLSNAGITPVAYHRDCAIVYIVIHRRKSGLGTNGGHEYQLLVSPPNLLHSRRYSNRIVES